MCFSIYFPLLYKPTPPIEWTDTLHVIRELEKVSSSSKTHTTITLFTFKKPNLPEQSYYIYSVTEWVDKNGYMFSYNRVVKINEMLYKGKREVLLFHRDRTSLLFHLKKLVLHSAKTSKRVTENMFLLVFTFLFMIIKASLVSVVCKAKHLRNAQWRINHHRHDKILRC